MTGRNWYSIDIVAVALICFANILWIAGGIMRSFYDTWYHVGNCFQAGGADFSVRIDWLVGFCVAPLPWPELDQYLEHISARTSGYWHSTKQVYFSSPLYYESVSQSVIYLWGKVNEKVMCSILTSFYVLRNKMSSKIFSLIIIKVHWKMGHIFYNVSIS